MENLTRYTNDMVRIRCEITGSPLPTYTWYKDSVPVLQLGERYSVKTTVWGSRSDNPHRSLMATQKYKDLMNIIRINGVPISFDDMFYCELTSWNIGGNCLKRLFLCYNHD
ncbi:hypothetical protein LSH36_13g11026 [Paralvinella palmiformis]|uniref:Ig-like domain-containing protein n=1 Tax=Paralvinella palmiformis TaxID=53620 RepID=A0AAD9KD81_9ANNE|nr:hypothetical protein LSH36_13g11026 [Paralvinella palmiformis]